MPDVAAQPNPESIWKEQFTSGVVVPKVVMKRHDTIAIRVYYAIRWMQLRDDQLAFPEAIAGFWGLDEDVVKAAITRLMADGTIAYDDPAEEGGDGSYYIPHYLAEDTMYHYTELRG